MISDPDYHYSDLPSDDYYYYYPDPNAPEGASVPIPSHEDPPPALSVEVELHTALDGVLECRVQWTAIRAQEYVVRWEREECEGCGPSVASQRLATVVQTHDQVGAARKGIIHANGI